MGGLNNRGKVSASLVDGLMEYTLIRPSTRERPKGARDKEEFARRVRIAEAGSASAARDAHTGKSGTKHLNFVHNLKKLNPLDI